MISRPRTRALGRRTTAATAAVLLGLTLAACGGDDSDSDDDNADQRSSETSTPDDATSTTDDDTDDDTGSSDGPSDDDLAGALITSSEVPAGFEQQPADEDDEENTTFTGTCFENLGKFSDALGVDDVSEAEAEFLQETATSQAGVGGELHFYGTDADVTGTFATFTDELRQCTEVSTTTEDGTQLDLAITYDDGAGVPGADDALGFSMTGTIANSGQTFPVAYRFEVALLGDIVSLVSTYTLGGADPAVLGTAGPLAVAQAERVAQLG